MGPADQFTELVFSLIGQTLSAIFVSFVDVMFNLILVPLLTGLLEAFFGGGTM